MKRRICALALTLCLVVTSASALTAEQTKEILDKYYIDEIPEYVLAQDTVEGVLEALGDPYTRYYTAQELADFYATMEDVTLVGIGIESYYREEGVLLTRIAPDSPAEGAGLRAGDYIIAIDGHDTRAAAETDIDAWIRGDMGTRVDLTIQREQETFEVTLTRRRVVFPAVWLEKVEDGIGWISCSSFGSKTFQQFYHIITTYDSEVEEWVVDLRGNTGGDALAAVFSAGCFGGRGAGIYMRNGADQYYSYLNDPEMIVSTGYYDGELSGFDEHGYLTDDAVYVLVDEMTASAAELFCAAIRDSGAGLIIGERTYGKGVAQSLFTADNHYDDMEGYFEEGAALKVTTERCFSLTGATYDQVGILPHFLVDGEIADEVAAILAAPVEEGEDVLYFLDLSSISQIVDALVIPMDLLSDPANAAVVETIFSVLPVTAFCRVRQSGTLVTVPLEEAARLCGVSPDRSEFTDLSESAYTEAVGTLGLYGMVSGSGDGTFRPGAALDRASLCALLAKTFRFETSGEVAVFTDVPADAWFAPYVNALYEIGIVNGCGDGLFYPNDPLSHEQFITILGRVAQWLNMDYYERARHDGLYGDLMPYPETLAETYSGYSDWAREMVWLCDDFFLWGGLSELDPQAPTTRDEATVALYNLLRVSGVLPA